MFNIQPMELMLILAIALLVFGPKKLPEFGRTIGKSLREFRRATNEVRQELRAELRDAESKPSPGRGDPSKPGEASSEPQTQGQPGPAGPPPGGDGQAQK